MENASGDRFGLQFHPEVNDSEYGARIFENFVGICERARRARLGIGQVEEGPQGRRPDG